MVVGRLYSTRGYFLASKILIVGNRTFTAEHVHIDLTLQVIVYNYNINIQQNNDNESNITHKSYQIRIKVPINSQLIHR